jgi:mannose-1-phosphate guanylyltransferase
MAAAKTIQLSGAGKNMQHIASNCINGFSCTRDLAAPLYGLVLAGGEGRRLKSYIKRLRGDSLPKQYVKFTSAHSMLEHTYRRAEKLIPRERLFTIVNQAHMKHQAVVDQLGGREPGTVIVQPENRDTGPGLLLPLMHIYKRYANAIVAVFPSDQFI